MGKTRACSCKDLRHPELTQLRILRSSISVARSIVFRGVPLGIDRAVFGGNRMT